jgi:hypothetical protein
MKSRDLGRQLGIGYRCCPDKKKCPRESIRGILSKPRAVIQLDENIRGPLEAVKHPVVRKWAGISEDPDILGAGSYGVAFTTDNPGVVLKITEDKAEFLAVSRLLDEDANLTHVAEFYDAVTIRTGPHRVYYGILVERLYPLDNAGFGTDQMKSLDEAINRFANDKLGFLPHEDVSRAVEEHYWTERSVGDFQQWLLTDPPKPDPSEYADGEDDPDYHFHLDTYEDELRSRSTWRSVFGENGLGEGLAEGVIIGLVELLSHGISFGDIHSGNVMSSRDGVVKLLDPGVSRTEGRVEKRDELSAVR